LLIAYEAMEHGEWRRLKACRNDTCQWGFYDHSKNRSKTWCSMEGCGSQVKSRAYRARKRAGGAARSGSSPSPSHSHPVR
jgi:predicted RNA-binding Zn ribbon-like protein